MKMTYRLERQKGSRIMYVPVREWVTPRTQESAPFDELWLNKYAGSILSGDPARYPMEITVTVEIKQP